MHLRYPLIACWFWVSHLHTYETYRTTYLYCTSLPNAALTKHPSKPSKPIATHPYIIRRLYSMFEVVCFVLDGVRRLALHHYQWSIKNATPPSMYIIYQGRLEELHLPAIISSNLSSMRHHRRLWHCPSWWLFSTVNGIKFIVFVYGWVHIFFRGIMSMCVS